MSKDLIKDHTPIYIIAGEASGDLLGENIIRSFPHNYVGVGGARMAKNKNFTTLFNSCELSVMGIMEVIPHISRLLRLIRRTVEHIIQSRPKALITIDAPDFNQRVVKMLRKHPAYKAKPFPCIHVGAPTVWAWRPGRAKKMAKLWDQLWTLFPFEPPYFTDLPTYFVGHPLGDPNTEIAAAREPHTCLLLPGSRVGEIQRHWPILNEICRRHPEMSYVLLTLPHLIPLIQRIAPPSPNCTVHTSYDMSRAHIALAASGTVSLELAKAGTPMITLYRLNALTAWIARRLVKTPYANLVNILLQKPAVPELIQEKATADNLSLALSKLQAPNVWQNQQQNLGEAIALLRGPKGSFGKSILPYLEKL